MSLYLIDSDYSVSSGREWNKMLPAFTHVYFNDESRPSSLIDTQDREISPPGNGRHLLLIHRSSIESGTKQIDIIKKLGIPILFVSNSPNQTEVPDLPATNDCHYRKVGVATREERVDEEFRKLFSEFWGEYQQRGKRKLDWSLLYPPDNVELITLLAVLSFSSATGHDAQEEVRGLIGEDQQRGAVYQQYLSQIGSVGYSAELTGDDLKQLEREGTQSLVADRIRAELKRVLGAVPD